MEDRRLEQSRHPGGGQEICAFPGVLPAVFWLEMVAGGGPEIRSLLQ